MRDSRERRYTMALGVGTADLFFILLSFFLVLTLAAEKAKQEELLVRLPFYSGKIVENPKESEWKIQFTKDWGVTDSDTILWVQSNLQKKFFHTRKRPPSPEFAKELKAFFEEFVDYEKRKRDIRPIEGFDIFADYETPYGAVFEVTAACAHVHKIHSIIYRELD